MRDSIRTHEIVFVNGLYKCTKLKNIRSHEYIFESLNNIISHALCNCKRFNVGKIVPLTSSQSVGVTNVSSYVAKQAELYKRFRKAADVPGVVTVIAAPSLHGRQ